MAKNRSPGFMVRESMLQPRTPSSHYPLSREAERLANVSQRKVQPITSVSHSDLCSRIRAEFAAPLHGRRTGWARLSKPDRSRALCPPESRRRLGAPLRWPCVSPFRDRVRRCAAYRSAAAHHRVIHDGQRVFASRIIGSQHDEIACFAGRHAHQGTLACGRDLRRIRKE